MLSSLKSHSASPSEASRRKARPSLEGLESRLLLYSTLGAQFVYGSRITYSFVPDGTNIGGMPSVLFQTLDSKFARETWQQQFQKAAAAWQIASNVNLVQVSDDGSPLGVSGYQQGDPRFGDIRISAIPQSNGTLAISLLPPPINGGTEAGDVIFNSNMNWQINTTFDIQSVAIHEFGHSLGLGHTSITSAVMYAAYTGVKQKLTTDDFNGIQAVWQAPQPDQFNSNGQSNSSFQKAVNLTSYIDAHAQIAIPDLSIHSSTLNEWYYVTVPPTTTGTMVAAMQSSNLSSLSPRITVFDASLRTVGFATSNDFGETVTTSVAVQAGQKYYIRVSGSAGGAPVGDFGLAVNFGSYPQAPFSPPNTSVPEQPDGAGGSMALLSMHESMGRVSVGNIEAWGETLNPAANRVPAHVNIGHGRSASSFTSVVVGAVALDDSLFGPLAESATLLVEARVQAYELVGAVIDSILPDSPVSQAIDSALSALASKGRWGLFAD